MSDQFREQMLEEARQRAWALISVTEVVGAGIDPEAIHRAALTPLSSTAADLAEKLGPVARIAITMARRMGMTYWLEQAETNMREPEWDDCRQDPQRRQAC